jgi:hypothetical protein
MSIERFGVTNEDAGGLDYDAEFAADLVGKTLLVGLTYIREDGALISRRQIFGTVVSCDERAGIVLRLDEDGELFTIAPITEAIEPASPGVYQLRDDDAQVTDPDFTALLTVTKPNRH